MAWIPFEPGRPSPTRPGGASGAAIAVSWGRNGLEYRPEPAREGWLADAGGFGADAELVRLLGQLEEEGFAKPGAASVSIDWQDFYRLAATPDDAHGPSVPLLKLPPMQAWRPALSSKGALSDADFAVAIAGWIDPQGQRPQGNVSIEGAVIRSGQRVALLPESAWRVVEAVARFWARPAGERTADSNRRAWSVIRSHAVDAGVDMSDFLRKTVVLTPQKLRIGMREGGDKAAGRRGGARVVELQPGFDGAPQRWLEIFDRLAQVPERYDVPDGQGIVQVMLSPPVRTVLREIRKMPGRRIAGERAEAFLRNPFATLGPDASEAIDPEQFEQARDAAGIASTRFTARVLRDESGYPCDCALLVEETVRGQLHCDALRFEGRQDLEQFLTRLEARIAASAQCCHWQGYDLEILDDTPEQAALLRAALRDMLVAGSVRAAEIFDLSQYSERIQGFGVEKPYYSPFIMPRNGDAGWFPENVDGGICYTPEGGGETIAIVINEGFRVALRKAEEEKRETFDFPACPKPIAVAWAKAAIATIDEAREDVRKGAFDPKKTGSKGQPIERKGLVLKPNVERLDYAERRGVLAPSGAPPRLPATLLPGIALKQHQLSGLAWLQHLWRFSPVDCRGALLADDMGLGKTVQLLAFIAAAIEEQPGGIDPFLIVAPVALLENWKEEIAKFFAPGAMRVLTLYGSALAAKRVPRRLLDAALIEGGMTQLLARGWLGDAQVVLTTYETLRDLEFSLAAQRWSAMVCDEAQKIKNPNAMMTRAAKKQNARFKIACTGTPVENTLADIWCLFDFVQPGLLGALKEFGSRYRRPIEAKTDEQKARVEELRKLIAPQTLRRTKAEVAKDLPRKIVAQTCRALPLSERQRAHYASAVAMFRQQGDQEKRQPASGLQTPLGLLQYLRRLCSDPRPAGQMATDAEPIAEIERHSPKMAWLLARLREVEASGEKVIVFCEFRDLQRSLQRAISERFGLKPDVINGDTSADSANAQNRQRRIRQFQDSPGFGVIVLSPLAVGFGVNIQAANHVVHFTRSWNPAKEDQATDRAYRIGQTRDVHVYYPVVVAQDFLSFDAKLDQLLDFKRGLATDMLNGAGELRKDEFFDVEAPDGSLALGEALIGVDELGTLDANAFEAFCALLWSKRGYQQTFRTGRVGDGGVDVLAIRGAEGVLIQCKSSATEGRELGWDAVKDVSAGAPAYAQRHPGVQFSLVAATNQRFNNTAWQQAQLLNVELVDAEDLARLLAQYPMRRGELEKFLLAG